MYLGLSAVLLLFQVVDYSNSYGHENGRGGHVSRYGKGKAEKVKTMRDHDMLRPDMELSFKRDVVITVRVFDSNCFSAASESPYVLYLGALNFDSQLIGWYKMESTKGVTMDESGIKELTVVYTEEEMEEYPETCFARGGDPCVPRADVIYIEYMNEPEDTWSLSRIEVDVQFRLWPGMENWYMSKYEHLILWPCDSWLDSKAFYKIGPRPGNFEKLDTAPVLVEQRI